MDGDGHADDPHRAGRTTARWSRSATPAPASRRRSSGRIFEPFFTTKPVGEGTGLGLDISWRIVVNKHHGDIRVESEPGDTRFLVRLPLTAPAGAPDDRGRRHRRLSALSTRRPASAEPRSG